MFIGWFDWLMVGDVDLGMENRVGYRKLERVFEYLYDEFEMSEDRRWNAGYLAAARLVTYKMSEMV